MRFPEEQWIGAVPVCSAKLASERNRWLPAVWPIRIAAVSAPQPCSASSLGRCAVTSSAQLAVQRVDLAAQAAQLGDLLARDAHARAGLELAQPAVDAVKHARFVERAALQRALQLGAQLEQVPPQPVDGAGPLGDEIVAVIGDQPDLHRPLVQVRAGEVLDPVLDDRAGDRERVDLV